MSRARNQGARRDYAMHHCKLCGHEVWAPPSRLAWVADMHGKRCSQATPKERLYFRRHLRWRRPAFVYRRCECGHVAKLHHRTPYSTGCWAACMVRGCECRNFVPKGRTGPKGCA